MFKYEINFSFSLWKYLYTTNLNIFFPMLRVSTEMIGIIKKKNLLTILLSSAALH